MIDPARSSAYMRESAQIASREIQLFEPPADELCTIETTSRIVDVPRRTILLYCKHHLLSPATGTTDHGYCFNGDAIRTLRRIEALRTVCGDNLAGIKIILDLNAALERLRSDIRLLTRAKTFASTKTSARNASPISSRRTNVKPSSNRKRK
jgi:DNA-binding transcriptional MerR regulator